MRKTKTYMSIFFFCGVLVSVDLGFELLSGQT
jgi:hypothetical protein